MSKCLCGVNLFWNRSFHFSRMPCFSRRDIIIRKSSHFMMIQRKSIIFEICGEKTLTLSDWWVEGHDKEFWKLKVKDKKATKSGKEDMGYLKNIGMGICLISLVNLVLASFFIYRYVRENGLDIKEGVSGRSLILFTYLNRLLCFISCFNAYRDKCGYRVHVIVN